MELSDSDHQAHSSQAKYLEVIDQGELSHKPTCLFVAWLEDAHTLHETRSLRLGSWRV